MFEFNLELKTSLVLPSFILIGIYKLSRSATDQKRKMEITPAVYTDVEMITKTDFDRIFTVSPKYVYKAYYKNI